MDESNLTRKKDFLTKILSPFKLEILEVLRSRPRTLSELTKITGKSKQVLLFHLRPLIRVGLVRKIVVNRRTFYQVTELGAVMCEYILKFLKLKDILVNAGEFFRDHDVSSIPLSVINDIHMLNGCRILVKNNPYDLHDEWLNILEKSTWVYGLSSVFHSNFPELFTNLAKERKVEIILTENVFNLIVRKYREKLSEYLKYGKMYVCGNVRLTFIVAEKGFTMNLYRLDGTYDSTRLLVCKTDEGVKWGLKLFDYYRSKSKVISID
ncbi:helix-turn-helix transcriptional regulator [Archaeoglobus sp.]